MRRIRLDMLRISRGPCRAPARLVVPPSQGTPTSAMSTAEKSVTWGRRMKVGMALKRGMSMPLTGS